MGIFGGQNRVKSQSSTTTLIAEGCAVDGHLKVANRLQIDGYVEGQVEAAKQIKISESGKVQGEIITERLIVNGTFDGTCHATYVEILNCGRVSGTIYSDNLSIELGGKFMGVTNPFEQELDITQKIDSISQDRDDLMQDDDEEDDDDITAHVTLINNEPRI